MHAPKLINFGLIFTLPQTKKNNLLRQRMFEYVKGFIQDIGPIKESKARILKTTADMITRDFSVGFESREEFSVGCIIGKLSAIETVNSTMNEIFLKLNETDWKEKSRIFMYSFLDCHVDDKQDLFDPLLNKKTFDSLFGGKRHYEARRIEIWQPPNGDKLRRGVTISRRKKGNMFESILSSVYKDNFPMDAISKACSELQNTQNMVLAKLIGEK